MTSQRVYPTDYSAKEIRAELSTLSSRITGYDARSGLTDDLIKDAVRFTLGSNELEHRAGWRIAVISLAFAIVATVATVAAFLSAKSAEGIYQAQLTALQVLNTRLDTTDSLRAELGNLRIVVDSMRSGMPVRRAQPRPD